MNKNAATAPSQPIISGPCVICGATNYDLSCGGPTICPKCDCGQFDAATVMTQSKALASLRSQVSELRDALGDIKQLLGYENNEGKSAAVVEGNANQAWHTAQRALASPVNSQHSDGEAK